MSKAEAGQGLTKQQREVTEQIIRTERLSDYVNNYESLLLTSHKYQKPSHQRQSDRLSPNHQFSRSIKQNELMSETMSKLLESERDRLDMKGLR